MHAPLRPRQQARYPLIESGNTLRVTAGQGLLYQITTTNLTQSFEASGLPAGITVNAQTGVIGGVPLEPGAFTVVLKASNASGMDVAELALTILDSSARGPRGVSLSAPPPGVKME